MELVAKWGEILVHHSYGAAQLVPHAISIWQIFRGETDLAFQQCIIIISVNVSFFIKTFCSILQLSLTAEERDSPTEKDTCRLGKGTTPCYHS